MTDLGESGRLNAMLWDGVAPQGSETSACVGSMLARGALPPGPQDYRFGAKIGPGRGRNAKHMILSMNQLIGIVGTKNF